MKRRIKDLPPHVLLVIPLAGLMALSLLCLGVLGAWFYFGGYLGEPPDTLWKAAELGVLPAVEKLIQEGADVNERVGFSEMTPLMFAARGGHADVVERLIREGADVHATDKYGDRAVHFAAATGSVPVLEILVAHGADCRVAGESGETPPTQGRKPPVG